MNYFITITITVLSILIIPATAFEDYLADFEGINIFIVFYFNYYCIDIHS